MSFDISLFCWCCCCCVQRVACKIIPFYITLAWYNIGTFLRIIIIWTWDAPAIFIFILYFRSRLHLLDVVWLRSAAARDDINIPPEIYFDLLRPRLFIYTGDRGAEIALQFVSLKTSPPRQTLHHSSCAQVIYIANFPAQKMSRRNHEWFQQIRSLFNFFEAM
jgi:hypothetical protein